jgi:hypothetical protein
LPTSLFSAENMVAGVAAFNTQIFKWYRI